jgi:guanylate kinase
MRRVENPSSSPGQGRLFVLSGPSGVGKDTVLAALRPLCPEVAVCVTATTRTPRLGESQGNPYLFLNVAEFERMIDEEAFLEFARVNGGNLYGTPRAWVAEQRAAGIDVILKIDVQGGVTIRSRVPDAILIFLRPPSFEDLETRLRGRMTESEEAIKTRLIDARSEMQQLPFYDYSIINDDIDHAADRLRAIILAERSRIKK